MCCGPVGEYSTRRVSAYSISQTVSAILLDRLRLARARRTVDRFAARPGSVRPYMIEGGGPRDQGRRIAARQDNAAFLKLHWTCLPRRRSNILSAAN